MEAVVRRGRPAAQILIEASTGSERFARHFEGLESDTITLTGPDMERPVKFSLIVAQVPSYSEIGRTGDGRGAHVDG